MRPSAKLLVLSAAALVLCGSIASATPPGSVTSTKGTVVVMRGNSVHQLSEGDKIQPGDRIISTSGSSASFSGGSSLGSNSSAYAKGDDDFKFSSQAGESSKSYSSNSSKIFDVKGYGHDEHDTDRHDNDRYDNDHHDSDYHNRNDSQPWYGHPKDPESCSN